MPTTPCSRAGQTAAAASHGATYHRRFATERTAAGSEGGATAPDARAASEPEIPGAHGGVIIQLDGNEFLIAGTGMIVTFCVQGQGRSMAGIDSIWEGSFVNDIWTPGRNLNGDDDNQGRYLRLPSGKFSIRRVKLYRYQ